MSKNRNQTSRTKRITVIVLSMLFLGIAVYTAYQLTRPNEYVDSDKHAQTTSEQPTAQPDFNDGEERDPGNTLREDEGSALIEEGSAANGSIDRSNPIISKSGQITVFSPQKGANLKSGDLIAGSSKLSRVSYRIIDNVSGVIAQGELKVTDGNFSGKIKFDTPATEGRLDLYATKSDGTEFSNIEIPIKFIK